MLYTYSLYDYTFTPMLNYTRHLDAAALNYIIFYSIIKQYTLHIYNTGWPS
jgi:hypothetical protein